MHYKGKKECATIYSDRAGANANSNVNGVGAGSRAGGAGRVETRDSSRARASVRCRAAGSRIPVKSRKTRGRDSGWLVLAAPRIARASWLSVCIRCRATFDHRVRSSLEFRRYFCQTTAKGSYTFTNEQSPWSLDWSCKESYVLFWFLRQQIRGRTETRRWRRKFKKWDSKVPGQWKSSCWHCFSSRKVSLVLYS